MMKRIFTLIIIMICLCLTAETLPQDEGKKAPDFELKTLDNTTVKLSDYEGKIVIIDFWATWCGPCRIGIPDLVEIQNEYKNELVVIGISLDSPVTQKNLKSFIEQFGINYLVVLGSNEVVEAYGNISAIPTSFIVNREGKIVNKQVGLVAKSTFINQIKNLIGKS